MTRNLADNTPEQLIAEIGKLREESKGYRLRASQYEQVFGKFTPEDQRGLLHVVSVFADDRTAGAGLFHQLADSVTGPSSNEPTVEQEPAMTDAQIPAAPPPGNEELRSLLATLQEKVDGFEAERQQWADQATQRETEEILAFVKEKGYKEGTPEWNNFFKIAGSDIVNGDLEQAHRLYPTFYPAPEGEAAPVTEPAAAAPAVEPAPEFPATGVKATVGQPLIDPGVGQELDLSKAATDARAIEYLNGLMAADSTT